MNKKTKLTLNLFLLFLFGANISLYSQDKSLEVYLLIGQSNTAGRSKVPKKSNVQSNILALNKEQKREVAKDPIHFDKDYAGAGPGISFAKVLIEPSR